MFAPQTTPRHGVFWGNTEREFNEFAAYYHLPSLSVKSAVYQVGRGSEDGMQGWREGKELASCDPACCNLAC